MIYYLNYIEYVTCVYKVWVYGRSHAGIVGSNPAGGMEVCVECCVLSGWGLWSLVQRSPTDCDASLCVWYRNVVNEEAMARVGLQRQRKQTNKQTRHT
jgi:uncharacterized membrane protein YfbV (UPF0208 family)